MWNWYCAFFGMAVGWFSVEYGQPRGWSLGRCIAVGVVIDILILIPLGLLVGV